MLRNGSKHPICCTKRRDVTTCLAMRIFIYFYLFRGLNSWIANPTSQSSCGLKFSKLNHLCFLLCICSFLEEVFHKILTNLFG